MHAIKVYSTTWCGFCHQLKAWLKAGGYKYEEVDIENDEEAQKEMMQATQQMGVPVTNIDGNWVVGFDRAKITELLSAEPKASKK
jgi:glutaredoxin 3